MKYYILNNNRRWQRAYRAGYNNFVLKGSENIIRCFDDYQVKEVYWTHQLNNKQKGYL